MKAREIALGALGAVLYLITFLALWQRFTAGQALGMIVVFHLVVIPCALALWCCAAPLLPRAHRALLVLIATPLASGWLAYAIVKHTGTSSDLIEEVTPCYDRQGTHPC